MNRLIALVAVPLFALGGCMEGEKTNPEKKNGGGQGDDQKAAAARARLTELTRAVESYHVRMNEFPATLEVLTAPTPDGATPLLKPEALLDPWGKPFQYDPAGTQNKGKTVDIWTVFVPDGTLIGNWQKK